MSGFERYKRRQIGKLVMPPVLLAAAAGVRVAYRHPLVVRLERDASPLAPIALGVALVILRAFHPGVVRRFVVVPDGDERVGGMHCARTGVAFVLGVPLAVVGQ